VRRIFFYMMILGVFLLLEAQPAFCLSSKVIPAKACIVIDDHDSVLYSRNQTAKLPPASTVKLVTAMVALDRLDPETKVRVSSTAGAVRSVKPRLKANEDLTVSDLLHLALMKSINSAAVALAEAAAGSEDKFVELMNQKAREIGANDTYFVTASGLPKGKQYTTARDLATILKRALSYPLIKEIIGKKEWVVTTAAGRELYMENTDNLLWYRSNMVGGKNRIYEQRTALLRGCDGHGQGPYLYGRSRGPVETRFMEKRSDTGRDWTESTAGRCDRGRPGQEGQPP
jgi:D-alanyl-D-alanine carboxypeptidase (penicillin-binding protein 5/6)